MKQTAAKLWTEHRDEQTISNCEKFAKYTLPRAFVDPLQVGRETLCHDFQSVGGLLVNNLSSKLVRTLFPPGIPFFKNILTSELRKAADAKGQAINEVENILAQVDQQAAEKLFLNAATAKLTRVITLLIITGNMLMYRDQDTAMLTVWSLRSFTVRRMANGVWRTVVLKQCFRFDELPDAIRNDYAAKKPGVADKPSRTVELFTRIEKTPGSVNQRVVVTNEIDGIRVGPESSYPEHLSPWIVATWNLADGEHYGRGMVEDYTGDFARLSLMSEQSGLYELESLSLLNLVDEAAGGVIDDYNEADVGDFVRGKTEGITSYERGDYNKINAVDGRLQGLIGRLSQAFMYTGNTRDAERVTAEEIRAQAKEAEQMLGGVYSLLAEQLQLPLAYLCMREVSDTLLAGLVAKTYRPSILTGIPALTRAIAVQNILNVSQEAAAVVPVLMQLDDRVDKNKVMDLLYNARSVDTSAIFKSAEVMAAEAQAKQQAAQVSAQSGNDVLLQAGPAIQDTLSMLETQ